MDPLVYMPEAQNGAGATGAWTIEHGMFNRRGIFYRARGGGGMECAIEPGYIQGAITPFLALENTWGTVSAQVVMKRVVMDTSSQAYLALWGANGNISAAADLEGISWMGVESRGGRPTALTGIPVRYLTAQRSLSVLGQ